MIDTSREVELPRAHEAVSYSLDTSRLPKEFDGLWDHLCRVLAASLRDFAERSGADALAWVDLSQWWDRKQKSTLLFAVYICTDAKVSRDDLAALEPALASSGLSWSVDGVMRRPRTARPLMAVVDGEVVRVWIRRPERIVSYSVAFGDEVGWVTHDADDSEPEGFLPEIGHAVGRLVPPNREAALRAERLKLVFAQSVAERIVHADGVLDDAEQAFLSQRFPEDRLAELGVDDASREALLAEAEAELATLLGHHEKLGLLSIFYAACYADGRLEVRELRVLKEAAEVLGLDRGEVAGYLQRLW